MGICQRRAQVSPFASGSGSKGAKSKVDRSTRKQYARPLEQGVLRAGAVGVHFRKFGFRFYLYGKLFPAGARTGWRPPKVGVDGLEGGNGREAKSRIGQGGQEWGGARSLQTQPTLEAAAGPSILATGTSLLSGPLGLRCGGGSGGGRGCRLQKLSRERHAQDGRDGRRRPTQRERLKPATEEVEEDAASEHRVSLARKVSYGSEPFTIPPRQLPAKPTGAASWLPTDPPGSGGPGCNCPSKPIITKGRSEVHEKESEIRKFTNSFCSASVVEPQRQARAAAGALPQPRRLGPRGRVRALFLKYPPNEPNFDFFARQGWLSGLPRRRCFCLSASLGQDLAQSVHSPVSLEPPWGKGWEVNSSQPPVPFVALLSFDTIKVKLIDSYH
ncbi:hypothetical protein EI555_007742 [Monodon monoceros]|uniref:Uncharacterized protein n=1 Tax=Monodon monoceros TaxID=40151 RepID=A0A4U1FH44_MONMO|nr:hypothetical protein EI555_007742 [Monodon monoceros]